MHRRRIGDASAMRRRCIVDMGGASATTTRNKSGSASLMHRPCIGDAAPSSDPIRSDHTWEAQSL
eukprot:5304805-Pyramimonas_sp.AAC.1